MIGDTQTPKSEVPAPFLDGLATYNSSRIVPSISQKETIMQAVTLSSAKESLERLVDQVLADEEPRILVADDGRQVVVMPLSDFNAWQETNYLLASPANAAHLLSSIDELRSGKTEQHELSPE